MKIIDAINSIDSEHKLRIFKKYVEETFLDEIADCILNETIKICRDKGVEKTNVFDKYIKLNHLPFYRYENLDYGDDIFKTEEENFKNYPKALSEKIAEKSNDASKWSPREALISVLRRIDSGTLDIDNIIILYEEGEKFEYTNSVKNLNDAISMCEFAKHRLIQGAS